MPTYDYVILNDDGTDSDTIIEIVHSIKAPALTFDPESGRPVRRLISGTGMVLIDPSVPRTIGSMAEKNTSEMVRRGDERIKPPAKPPWWRDSNKRKDFSGYTEKQIENYIFKGNT